jgi:hypothetical protein
MKGNLHTVFRVLHRDGQLLLFIEIIEFPVDAALVSWDCNEIVTKEAIVRLGVAPD